MQLESHIIQGELAVIVKEAANPFVSDIVDMIHIGLTIKTKNFICPEALVCVSMLAKAVGQGRVCIRSNFVVLRPFVPALLDKMFAGGLSLSLTESLGDLAYSIPGNVSLST